MCGIAGFVWDTGGASCLHGRAPGAVARGMADRILHRGPDSAGDWLDADRGVALAHRRLAIVDLSAQGDQPMLSASGRYVVTFNGEIYNYLDIRSELDRAGSRSTTWRGTSDTEVLLAAFDRWGIEASLQRASGMWALSVWDREQSELTLATDRMGEKPLYCGWVDGAFVFASELSAIHEFPGFERRIDPLAVSLLMQYAYVPFPHTIYGGIQKLSPGCLVVIKSDGKPREVSRRNYWSLRERIPRLRAESTRMSVAEWEKELLDRLRKVVGREMLADVPLGAFLSGGIDSTLVVALMQEVSTSPISTFTIGYEDSRFSEAHHAREVARHLGTDHTEFYLSSSELLGIIPKMPTIYSEPFADSSQLPTYLVSKLARSFVTVALTGDGGDELFAGYNRYLWWRRVHAFSRRIPKVGQSLIGNLLGLFRPSLIDAIFTRLGQALPGAIQIGMPGDRFAKMARILSAENPRGVYAGLTQIWDSDPMIAALPGLPGAQESLFTWAFDHFENKTEAMQFADQVAYLPNDILVKLDRASMANSLETRAPFLDHSIVELSWSLPFEQKIDGNQTKVILRRLLDRYVPSDLMARPKMGFSVPIDDWLRKPLRSWAENLLDPKKLRDQGIFDTKAVRALWERHLSGRRNNQHALWCVLMYQGWAEEWKAHA